RLSMSHEQKWPDVLWIVRHGQSASNVARDAAEACGAEVIKLDAQRDMDVPLSELGAQQATALGRWFGQMPTAQRPAVVLTSTYLRSQRTAEIALAAAGIERDEITFITDER